MATLTKAGLLDLGAPFEDDPLNPQNPPEVGQAWRDAFYNGFIGTQQQPLGFGFFLSRVARTVTGATVTANTHTTDLPGPVLNIQATAGSSTGAKTVIVTGTPGGVGEFRRPPVFLKPGDVIPVEIEAIGKLVNPVERW